MYQSYEALVSVTKDNKKITESLKVKAKTREEAVNLTISCYYSWYKLNYFDKYEIISVTER